MKIADRQVKHAIETIIAELEAAEQRIAELENEVATLEGKLEEQEINNDKLLGEIAEIKAERDELDEALAVTYVSQTEEPKTN